MAVDFLIDVDRQVVFTVAVDVLTMGDGLDHMNRLQADPRFSPVFNQIADFRAVTEVRLSGFDVRDLAKRTLFSPEARRALVITRPLAFGLARMFRILRGLRGENYLTVVRELDEAARWTGVDPHVAADTCATLAARLKTSG